MEMKRPRGRPKKSRATQPATVIYQYPQPSSWHLSPTGFDQTGCFGSSAFTTTNRGIGRR